MALQRLDADTERAAYAFLRAIKAKYPVKAAILYGSRARGDHRPDSDTDIAVILMGEPAHRADIAADMARIEFCVLLETGVMVQGFPLWEGELNRPDAVSNPALIENILREGITL